MAYRSRGQLVEVPVCLATAEAQSVNLVSQLLNGRGQLCLVSQTADDVDAFARDDERQQLPVDAGVFDQRRVVAECSRQGRRIETLRTRARCLAWLQLPTQDQQVCLALTGLGIELGGARTGGPTTEL